MNGMKNSLYSFKDDTTKNRDMLDLLGREEREAHSQGRNPYQMQAGKTGNQWGMG